MAETDPHHPSGRQDAYLRACEGILRTHFGRRPFSAAANAIAQLQREEKQKLLSAEHGSVLRWYEALGRLRGRWFAPYLLIPSEGNGSYHVQGIADWLAV